MSEHCQLPAVISQKPVAAWADAHPLIIDAGAAGLYAWEEFIFGLAANSHTQRAYGRSIKGLLDWLNANNIALKKVRPMHIAQYFAMLSEGTPKKRGLSIPSKKVALAAMRKFFDLMVSRHAIGVNPVSSFHGERYEAVEGKTPEITPQQARQLLNSIDSPAVGALRDKAVISTLIFTAARAGAVAKLRGSSLYHDGTQYLLRFEEKNGKSREIPVRHDLQLMLAAYRAAGGLEDAEPHLPLFRSVNGRTGRLRETGMTPLDICRMVKRRLRNAGLSDRLSPHSFRVCTITDLLTQGVVLEDVQYLAGHSDPRTTRLYDRRQRRVTRNIVERISI